MSDPKKRAVYTVLELAVLFVLLPVFYWLDWIPVHKIIPLLALFLYCSIVLVRKGEITARDFSWKGNWSLVIIRFVLAGAAILLYILWFTDYNVWADFDSNRKLLHMVLMYPLLSALPQELIFRKFFLYRYASLIPNSRSMIVVNAVFFSFAHIYFSSPLVLIFTFLGGLIFSMTYLKSKSLLVVTIEHTLYGLLILTSGLSDVFYKAF